MTIYDISHTLSMSSPEWPEQPPLEIGLCSKMKEGDMANLTYLNMVAHSGTHIDAPCHFLNGASSVESLSLDKMVGPAIVLEVPDVERITVEVLENAPLLRSAERVLFKTDNTKKRLMEKKAFEPRYVSLSPEGAMYLVEKGVKLVGIDYLSIAPFEDSVPTHEILLGAEVVVVEGLNLVEVKEGRYSLYCLPVKISGADGAPARAILIE